MVTRGRFPVLVIVLANAVSAVVLAKLFAQTDSWYWIPLLVTPVVSIEYTILGWRNPRRGLTSFSPGGGIGRRIALWVCAILFAFLAVAILREILKPGYMFWEWAHLSESDRAWLMKGVPSGIGAFLFGGWFLRLLLLANAANAGEGTSAAGDPDGTQEAGQMTARMTSPRAGKLRRLKAWVAAISVSEVTVLGLLSYVIRDPYYALLVVVSLANSATVLLTRPVVDPTDGCSLRQGTAQ
jgi:hypothetical protein